MNMKYEVMRLKELSFKEVSRLNNERPVDFFFTVDWSISYYFCLEYIKFVSYLGKHGKAAAKICLNMVAMMAAGFGFIVADSFDFFTFDLYF